MTDTKEKPAKPLNLHQRIAAVMAEVTYVQKQAKKGMQYTIVSHDAVTAKVRPILLKHGVIYYPTRCDHTHNGNRAECTMTVRFANIDQPDDCIDVPSFGYGVDPQDKGPGKAMSYAVKYALLKALGLETGDDADHDSIDHEAKDPHKPAPEPKPEPVKATERDPVAIANGIIGTIAKIATIPEIEAYPADGSKAAAAWDWLELEAPDEAARVKQAHDKRKNDLAEAPF